ncbi:MAG TPA: Uma2 family endonuclease [Actinophytocola sp.]|uniref:Uma2 family endonuclease n=1 Tax=Actinophytocola sp. TaxID=1872138 RepID=UPI002DDD12AE|nr:Uma2 family endonuclease [Actinophytocola sp.]HEV2779133.1 Uma2 family endonuclease [Actinophytocola sp.]
MGFALTEKSDGWAHSGPWTIEDVEALPDYGNHNRYELLSPGVLTVSPAPGFLHQRASLNLAVALRAVVPADMEVVEAVNVEIPGGRLCQPDIVIVDAAFADTAPTRCPPHTIRLVVEIVSPSSHPQDRIIKPQLYAEAKIPVYWRLEIEGNPRLIVSVLRRGRYVQEVAAVGGTRMAIRQPFTVELDPAELIRRAPR